MSNSLIGLGVGSGFAFEKAVVIKKIKFDIQEFSDNTCDQEWVKFQAHHSKSEKEITQLIKYTSKNISKDKADVFEAHLEILKDQSIISEIQELIKNKKTHAFAIDRIFEKYISIFQNMEDKYFKERATDLKDIKNRLLRSSFKIDTADLMLINEPSIIVAYDLTPSETATLNKKYIKGFVTDIGGLTSHSAIMAKSLGIPAIVSLKNITDCVKNGEYIALETKKSCVYYGVQENEKKLFEEKKKKFNKFLKKNNIYKTSNAITLDGIKINILGNIGNSNEFKSVQENGGEGIGLFRSEFLYMGESNWPNEEKQFLSYKQVLSEAKNNIVTIRTLDIGGDKFLSYYKFPKEMNPFLGYRAIRMCLKEKSIFKTQLRALLRASVFGNLKIMFPMISTYDEFMEAKQIFLDTKNELLESGKKVSESIALGIMIETPAAALMANKLSQVVDFFSIGTNDLIQYTHAVDRMSNEVSHLYQPNSPGILKLIKLSADEAKKNKIYISVCGEMASSPLSVCLLIGLGITNLSMSSGSILEMKHTICNIKYSDCKKIALKALNCNNEKEVNEIVNKLLVNLV